MAKKYQPSLPSASNHYAAQKPPTPPQTPISSSSLPQDRRSISQDSEEPIVRGRHTSSLGISGISFKPPTLPWELPANNPHWIPPCPCMFCQRFGDYTSPPGFTPCPNADCFKIRPDPDVDDSLIPKAARGQGPKLLCVVCWNRGYELCAEWQPTSKPSDTRSEAIRAIGSDYNPLLGTGLQYYIKTMDYEGALKIGR